MSKAKGPDPAPKTPNKNLSSSTRGSCPPPADKAEVFAELRAELERELGWALEQARREMLAKEGNPDPVYEAGSRAAATVQTLLLTLSLPLFAMEESRARWNVYLEGMRGLLRDYRHSHLLRAIFPMLKIGELGEKTHAWTGEALELLHTAELFLEDLDRYLQALAAGQEILVSYGRSQDEGLARVYATLKTWEETKEFEKFAANFEKLLDQSVTVVVEGPIQLYLMLSREGFLLIFRALSASRLEDRKLQDRDLASLMKLHDDFRGKVENWEARKRASQLLRRALEIYFERWRQKQEERRSLLPTEELRKRFIERFERGVIFIS